MEVSSQVDYEAVLADLLAKRSALDAAIEGIRRISGLAIAEQVSVDSAEPTTGSKKTSTLQSDSFFNMSIGDAVHQYLEGVKRPQTLKAIGEALERGGLVHQSTNFSATIHTALSRRTKDFIKPKRGQWGLRKWYSGKKQGAESALLI